MIHRVVFLFLAAGVLSAPSTDVVPLEKQQPTVIPIVAQSEEIEANGTYKFSYETANGIKREETSFDKDVPKIEGRIGSKDKNEGGESEESDQIHVQQGSYSYTAPDGTIISLRYIADENGFRPIGDHLPKAPALFQETVKAESDKKSSKSLDSVEAASAPVPLTRSLKPSDSVKAESPKPSEAAPSTEAPKSENTKTDEKTSEPEKSTEVTEPPTSTTSEGSTSAETDATTKSDLPSTTESVSSSEASTTEVASTTTA